MEEDENEADYNPTSPLNPTSSLHPHITTAPTHHPTSTLHPLSPHPSSHITAPTHHPTSPLHPHHHTSPLHSHITIASYITPHPLCTHTSPLHPTLPLHYTTPSHKHVLPPSSPSCHVYHDVLPMLSKDLEGGGGGREGEEGKGRREEGGNLIRYISKCRDWVIKGILIPCTVSGVILSCKQHVCVIYR